jgi:hypothetical protein
MGGGPTIYLNAVNDTEPVGVQHHVREAVTEELIPARARRGPIIISGDKGPPPAGASVSTGDTTTQNAMGSPVRRGPVIVSAEKGTGPSGPQASSSVAAMTSEMDHPGTLSLTNDIGTLNGNGLQGGHSLVNGNGAVNGNRLRGTRSLVNGNGAVNGNGLQGTRGLTNGNGAAGGKSPGGSRGLTNGNGIVNGNGVQGGRGLVNGNGAVNGNGLVSNHGLINGNGLINGEGGGRAAKAATKARTDPGPLRTGKRRRTRIAALAVATVAVITVLPVLAMLLSPPPGRMAVDGDFSDWQGATVLSDGKDGSAPSPDLDIVRYSTAVSGDSAFFYVEVAGRILSGKTPAGGVDEVNVFIDTDMNESTGYAIHGVGADFRLETYGWNGQVRGSTLYKFTPGRARLDWNGWASAGSLSALAQGRRLEMSAARNALGIHGTGGYRALFQIMDSRSRGQDFAKALAGTSGGALLVAQTAADLATLPIPSENQQILSLELTAMNRNIRVRQMVFSRSGDVQAQDVGVVQLRSGKDVLASGRFLEERMVLDLDQTVSPARPLTLGLCVQIYPTAASGRLFGAGLAGHDAVVLEKGTATVSGAGETRYYLGTAPQKISIDGSFGDWTPFHANIDPAGDIGNPDADLVEARSTKDASSISFYARVDGTMLGGSVPPEATRERPVPSPSRPSGPSPVQPPLPVLIGSDTVKVFIDSDDSSLTGCSINGLDFGADYALAASGAGGDILSRTVYSWSNITGDWVGIGTFAAAKDTTRMEMQAPLELLGLNASRTIRVLVFASDWTGKGDYLDRPILMADPLQLTNNGTVFYSSDGSAWTNETTIGQWGTHFTDLCADMNGNAYALSISGAVYKSTGNWTSWTNIINATLTNATAIAVNGVNFYAVETDGDAYKTTSGTNWTKKGTITCNNDTVDMCNDSSGNLYAIRSNTSDYVFKSTDGGTTWNAWGNMTVGSAGSNVTNVGITYGIGWGSTKYAFILQSNGDIRYDNNGSNSSPWKVFNFTNSSSDFYDIAIDNTGHGLGGNKYLWLLELNGSVYTFKFNAAAPNGVWTTNLSSSNVTDAYAIVVNQVPEFKDALLPMTGMIAVFILIRSRRLKRTGR